jgi:hypothetical protein
MPQNRNRFSYNFRTRCLKVGTVISAARTVDTWCIIFVYFFSYIFLCFMVVWIPAARNLCLLLKMLIFFSVMEWMSSKVISVNVMVIWRKLWQCYWCSKRLHFFNFHFYQMYSSHDTDHGTAWSKFSSLLISKLDKAFKLPCTFDHMI